MSQRNAPLDALQAHASERYLAAEAAGTFRPAGSRAISLPRRAGAIVATWLGRLAALPHDSRDGLRSNEHELASLGIRWDSDPDEDRALAEQILIARAKRQGASAPPAPLPSVHRADLAKAA